MLYREYKHAAQASEFRRNVLTRLRLVLFWQLNVGAVQRIADACRRDRSMHGIRIASTSTLPDQERTTHFVRSVHAG